MARRTPLHLQAPSLLAAAALAVGCGGNGLHLPVGKVERRLPSVRQLRFQKTPDVTVVSKSEFASLATRQFAADVRRLAPRQQARIKAVTAQARVAAQVPVLLGLIPARASERKLGAAVQLEGLYDGIANRVYMIRDTLGTGPKAENVLAHELTHALEDQNLGPNRHRFEGPLSDAQDAERALREGSATLSQVLYGIRFQGRPGPPERHLRAPALPWGTTKLQRLAAAELSFVYITGSRFVDTLYRRGGWRLVNRALRKPPTTTAAILQPERWFANESPRPPAGSPAAALGSSWAHRLSGDFGAASTGELLSPDGAIGGPLVRDWEGGKLELWQRRTASVVLRAPELRTSTVAIAWRWRRPADVALARRLSASYLTRTFGAAPAGSGAWRWDSGAAAYAGAGTTSALVLAPTVSLARAAAVATARR